LLANAALFEVFFGGMVIAGVQAYNSDQSEHGQETVSLLGYLGTSDFAEATFENWESEFLQMGMHVILTSISFTGDPRSPSRSTNRHRRTRTLATPPMIRMPPGRSARVAGG
jgi:hypothetical protein